MKGLPEPPPEGPPDAGAHAEDRARSWTDDPHRRRARHVFVATFALTYAAAMAAMIVFVGPVPWHVPFLVLNAVVVVNVAYVLACLVTTIIPPRTLDEADLSARDPADLPRVALLYCSFNDAEEPAIAAACAQEYPAAEVFLLDDSTEDRYRELVDEAAAAHGATVVRRADRTGFKGGAINHWLAEHGDAFDHLVILDADSTLPPEWTRRMVAKMEANPRFAMLHSRSESHEERTWFSKMLRDGIAIYMASIAHAESAVGPMLSWGHNVVCRIDALREAGGVVEARAEDLATSMNVMADGWDVGYAHDVVAYEQTPPTYQDVRKRNIRWGEGTLEARKYLSPEVPLPAKLSLLWRSSAFLAGPALLAIAVLIMLGLPAPNAGLKAVWGIMVLSMGFLPLPMIARSGQKHGSLFWYWVGAGFMALGSLVSSTYLLLKGLFKGHDFAVTPKEARRVPLHVSVRVFALEVLVGFLLVWFAWLYDAVIGFVWGGMLMATPIFNTLTSREWRGFDALWGKE